MTRYFLVLTVLALTACQPSDGKLAGTTSCIAATEFAWPNFTLRLGDIEQRRPVYRLHAGRMSTETEKSVEMQLRNLTSRPVHIADARLLGNVQSVAWASSSDSNELERTLAPKGSVGLRLLVRADDPKANSSVQLSDSCGNFIALIVVKYEEVPNELHGTRTKQAWSGQRKRYGPRQDVCIGPAPAGYKKVEGSESVGLAGYRTVCRSWLTCFDEKLKTEDVCYGVSPMGNEKTNGQYATFVTVSADYTLVGTEARLAP